MKLINDDNPFENPVREKEPQIKQQTMLRRSIADIV